MMETKEKDYKDLTISVKEKVLSKSQKIFLTIFALLGVGILGYLDRIETHYLSLMIFYLIPITCATWYVTKWSGYLALCASALSWLYDDVMTSQSYLRPDVPYWDIATKIAFCVIFINILSTLKRALDTEKKYARIDYLTETANLRYFFDVASMEISKARRYHHSLTLAYLDLDNFKYINDTFGHDKGNDLLKLTAQTLKESLRASDIVARVGGDEFAILLPETNQQQAEIALNRLKQNVSNMMSRYRWSVTFSMGVVTCDSISCSFDTLMTKADDLMYSIKRNGKNMIRQILLEADKKSEDEV